MTTVVKSNVAELSGDGGAPEILDDVGIDGLAIGSQVDH
jgi:hypothetical protein